MINSSDVMFTLIIYNIVDKSHTTTLLHTVLVPVWYNTVVGGIPVFFVNQRLQYRKYYSLNDFKPENLIYIAIQEFNLIMSIV